MSKQKKKATSFKLLKKSTDDITQIDSQTYYHKSSDPDKEPYMVFHSQNGSWLCDCMAFVMNIQDDGKGKECKHVTRIRKMFNQ